MIKFAHWPEYVFIAVTAATIVVWAIFRQPLPFLGLMTFILALAVWFRLSDAMRDDNARR